MRSLAVPGTWTVFDRRRARSAPVLLALLAVLAGGLVVVAAAPTPARAEVGPYRNLAPAAKATQGSTDWGGVATRAQDGDTNGVFSDNSVSHTASQHQPWWAADLGSVSSIGTIQVWNRTDCCTDRLSDFYVLVSDTPILSTDLAAARAQAGVSSCHVSSMSGPSVTVNVNRTGRYVRVQLAGTNYLALAEVKILSTQTLPAIDAQGWVTNNPFGGFIHYGPGTYTERQWADPNTPASVFNPTNLDADQWAQGIKSAGMTFGMLTAKHHDGFALWPTDYSTYDVASSPYQGGNGDVVREYVDAMRAHGLKVGIYFSVWDRHNGETTELVKNQLRELLTQYGRIDYLWFDGWGWNAQHVGTPYSKIPNRTVRDFVRDVSPTTVVAVNDEKYSFETTDVLVWETNANGFPPPSDTRLKDASGTLDSNNTWFYNEGPTSEYGPTGAPKPAGTILSNLASLNQSNGLYLLNVGPDKTGRFPQAYMNRLAELGQKAQLVARHSGKCLSVSDWSTADEAPMVQWTCGAGSANQQWVKEDLGNGYFRLVSRRSGKCLSVSGASTADGASIIQWTCTAGTNQQWSLQDDGSGYKRLVARNSGKCLSVSGASTADGASVIQWTCTAGTNQQWSGL